MRMFLRKSNVGREPLAIAMSGVRMGERLLQIGIDDPAVLGALAAKVGMSGHAVVVTLDDRSAARARAAVADASALADVTTATDGSLPFDADSFDVVVVHAVNGLLTASGDDFRMRLLGDVLRVTRGGGRVIVTEAGERSGLKAMLAPAPKKDERYEQSGGTVAAMEKAGFRPVRLLAERDGVRFVEALKTPDMPGGQSAA
jgi:SAM-dependent methyltransferase